MKILFVNPSLRPEANHRYLPVGLGYVATYAKHAGYDFDILDIDIGGYDDTYVENYLAKNRYDVISLGAIVTHYKWIKWFINTAKRLQPSCKVVLGNSVGASIPEVIFRTTAVDAAIMGEAEVTFVEMLKTLEAGRPLGEISEPHEAIPHTNCDLEPTYKGHGVEGIIFRDTQNRIINNGRRKAVRILDDLPFPEWELFDVEQYIRRSHEWAHQTSFYPKEEAVILPIHTARGCVFKCTFCHYVFWNDPYRHRSAQSIISEIKLNKEKFGANYFFFWDDLSFHKLGPAEKFVDSLLEADLGVHWTASVRSDLFGRAEIPYEDRRRVAEKFLESGNLVAGYSLESGSDEILEAMNKRVKAEYFEEQTKLLRDVGIVVNTSVVVGYPQETKETIAQTMQMCEKLKIYPSVGFLLPLPETGMWKYAVDNGFITDPDDFLENVTERQDVIMNMTQMPDEELMGEVTRWLAHLNEVMGRNLDKESLIRTGGYSKHNKYQSKKKGKDSLNYATVSDTM